MGILTVTANSRSPINASIYGDMAERMVGADMQDFAGNSSPTAA
jgi:hypothetical protein